MLPILQNLFSKSYLLKGFRPSYVKANTYSQRGMLTQNSRWNFVTSNTLVMPTTKFTGSSGSSHFGASIQSIALAALFLIGMQQTDENNQCSQDTQLKQNQLENRHILMQYPANKPIEDRYQVSQLTTVEGYVASVFDGHGGWQIAELCQRKLHNEIDRFLAQNKGKYASDDEWVQESVKLAYESIENEYLQVARASYQMGFASVARVGCCALTAVVINNKLYSSNLGDCKGIVINVDEAGKTTFRKINHRLNANSRKEQLRMRAQFPDEDIIICRNGTNACYVKNRLQPTRALGDLRMKHAEFNNPNKESKEKGFAHQIENWRGPYINHVPDQKIIDLQKGDKYLIMGSDGLWDELTKKQIADIASGYVGKKEELLQSIFTEGFKHAAQSRNMSVEDLRDVKEGKRRKLHDDMTIVVVDLREQV